MRRVQAVAVLAVALAGCGRSQTPTIGSAVDDSVLATPSSGVTETTSTTTGRAADVDSAFCAAWNGLNVPFSGPSTDILLARWQALAAAAPPDVAADAELLVALSEQLAPQMRELERADGLMSSEQRAAASAAIEAAFEQGGAPGASDRIVAAARQRCPALPTTTPPPVTSTPPVSVSLTTAAPITTPGALDPANQQAVVAIGNAFRARYPAMFDELQRALLATGADLADPADTAAVIARACAAAPTDGQPPAPAVDAIYLFARSVIDRFGYPTATFIDDLAAYNRAVIELGVC